MRLLLVLVSLALLLGCTGTSNQSGGSGVKEFSAVISGYSYNPSSINVNFGDTVSVTIRNDDGVTHGISLPVFGVREFVQPGATKTIQFVANQRGAPETFCSTDHGEKLLIQVNG